MRPLAAWAVVPLLLLAGCAAPRSAPGTPQPAAAEAGPSRTPPPTATQASPQKDTPEPFETQTDSQGSIVFEVTPLSLKDDGSALEFDVAMNTHSVDLAWDLAAQSVLRTDSGREVPGLSWPLGSGHHYAGTLSFPGQAPDGSAVLQGARTVTLTIRDTDVPERVFTWEVPS